MTTKLWELSDDLINLENAIADTLDDGSLSDEEREEKSEVLFEEWLKSSGNFDEKALRVAAYIRHQEAIAEARKTEAKRISRLATQAQNQADRLRGYLIKQMTVTGKKKVEGIDGKISLRKLPPKVVVTNPEKIPQEFLKVEVSPRLSEIKKAIKANPEIEWATLEESHKYSLTLR